MRQLYSDGMAMRFSDSNTEYLFGLGMPLCLGRNCNKNLRQEVKLPVKCSPQQSVV